MTEETIDLPGEKEKAEFLEKAKIKAQKDADKVIRKNKREITRLTELAQAAVLENNFESYKYALTKLRNLYRQPSTDELIKTLWETTRRQVWNILNANPEKI